MALRLSVSVPSTDGRIHREEDLTLSRTASRRDAILASFGTPSSLGPRPNATAEISPVKVGWQMRRIVLPDPVTFRFLEEDPSVSVVERRRVLEGYELYLVEQWACSRQSPTLIIATYTGDPRHTIVAGVLAMPLEERDWSPRLRVYFNAVEHYHARPKDTEAGQLMVTNLSSFPSALTVIPIPDGDVREHRRMFFINENLKRLGCSGRSGLTLSEPTTATQAKFLHLYKTNERVPFLESVIELIKLCQIALFLFGKLEREYIDGLLCDLTETAINDWWTEVGSEYYNIEPTDGILGPTTVAALLGTLVGARNRLSYYGATVPKDAFDLDGMKRGIGMFQKSCKLERTRRLDRQTLLKLHSVTAKAASGEGGWGVQRAVKSTVAEIGGKRGEIVMDMVGGRDKAGIADIETLVLDKFISLAHGERAKWLWHGKPKKTLSDSHDSSAPDANSLIFGKETKEDPSTLATGRRAQSLPMEEDHDARQTDEGPAIYPATTTGSMLGMGETPGDRDALRKTVFKSVAGKVSDARSGFGRIRDAVGAGLRGHGARPSRDDTADNCAAAYSSPSISTLAQSSAALTSPVLVGRAFTWKNKPEEYANALRRDKAELDPTAANAVGEGGREMHGAQAGDVTNLNEEVPYRVEGKPELAAREIRKELVLNDVSVPTSVVDECDLQGPILAAERKSPAVLSCLQRRHSVNVSSFIREAQPNEDRWPRRLSFSEAEDAVLRWEDIVDVTDLSDAVDDAAILQRLLGTAEISRSLYDKIAGLQFRVLPWVSSKVVAIEELDSTYARQRDSLQDTYYQLTDAYQNLKHTTEDMLSEKRGYLTEAVKEVEVLTAKLEYEINALASKVQDVDDGVAQFEAQVEDVERRAEELKTTLETEGWLHWLVRTLTGIGTGPNITREGP